MSIKEYVPKNVKVVGDKDDFGVVPYSVIFSTGESAFLRAKNAPEVGKPERGEIIDAPKKNGTGTYKKFVREKKEYGGKPSSKDEGAIQAMWAIRTAVQAGLTVESDIEEFARILNSMVDRVKNNTSIEPEQAPIQNYGDDIPL